MDVHDELNHLEATIRGAKAMPMSASCLVNRAEMLEMVGRLRGALPANLDHAKTVLSERDALLAAGREQAERILQAARAEREVLIDQNDVLVVARERAATLATQARGEAVRLLADADGYVDRKLAEFEVLLGQLGSQVNNGRLRLTTRRAADQAHFEGTAQATGQEDAVRGAVPGAEHLTARHNGQDDVPAESGAALDPDLADRQGPAAVDATLGVR
ncbi:MAG TPA: hypothetical protein VES02_12330 [Dermatophilaceae bacterium]|nr:hypothetical protein [Dermatophilaceae bacterium]